jgi:chemotaxis protein MotB
MAKAASGDQRPIIVIKKKKKVEGGHHGGAWKVAYADFVTAMMAFFLLLWLLNVTTKEQKLGIAEYFAPTSVSDSSSGAGGVMGGQSMVSPGAQDDPLAPITAVQPIPPTGETGEGGAEGEAQAAPDPNVKQIAKEVMEAIEDNPDLAEMKENIRVDETPEGVRIQIVDTDGRSMFPSGSAKMYAWTQALLKEVAAVIAPLPNAVSIRGHTDGAPFRGLGGYNNWDLSTDRANASRQVLANSGLDQARLANVTGKADRDHFLPNDPLNPQNRRISIVLMKDSVAKAQGWKRDPAQPEPAKPAAPAEREPVPTRSAIDGRGAQAPVSSGD